MSLGERAAVPIAVILEVGSQVQQLSITWELARNVNSWALPQTSWTRNFGIEAQKPGFQTAPQ